MELLLSRCHVCPLLLSINSTGLWCICFSLASMSSCPGAVCECVSLLCCCWFCLAAASSVCWLFSNCLGVVCECVSLFLQLLPHMYCGHFCRGCFCLLGFSWFYFLLLVLSFFFFFLLGCFVMFGPGACPLVILYFFLF